MAALPLLALTLTDRALPVSLVSAAQFLPWLVVGPWAGAAVDRWERRSTVLIVQMLRAGLMLALALAVFAGFGALWQIYVVAFLITAGEILVDPALLATVPLVVDDEQLEAANGRMVATYTVADEMVGSTVGAATFGLAPWLPFAIDATSYALSTERFRFLPLRKPEAVRAPTRVRDDVAEGFRFLWSNPVLRRLTTAFAALNFGAIGVVGLLSVLIVDVLNGSELSFGLLLAVGSVAAVGGSLSASWLSRWPAGWVMMIGGAVQGLGLMWMGAATSVPMAAFFWALAAAPAGVIMPMGMSYQQRLTPNELLGRLNVTSRIITRTSVLVGAVFFGALADVTSVRLATVIAGGVIVVSAPLLFWAAAGAKQLEGNPEDGPEGGPEGGSEGGGDAAKGEDVTR